MEVGTFLLPTTTDHSLGPSGPEGREEILRTVLKGVHMEYCEGEDWRGAAGDLLQSDTPPPMRMDVL